MSDRPVVGPRSYTKAWYKKRKTTIGASEAAGVVGLSRWSQPLSVYKSKVSGDDGGSVQTKAMRRGHALEPYILKAYHERVGGAMKYPVPMLIHPEFSFMSATPDALWTESDSIKPSKIMDHSYIPVDAKTTGHFEGFGEEGTDEIPQEYVLQAQQQMAVCGATRCDLPVMFPNFEILVYPILRNDSLIEMIVEAEKELIERVRDKNPPEPNWEHPKTYDLVRELHDVTEESIELNAINSSMWDEIEELGQQRSAIAKAISERKSKVLHDIGDAGIGLLPDGRKLIRKKIHRAAREVAECDYVSLRCKKPDKESEI